MNWIKKTYVQSLRTATCIGKNLHWSIGGNVCSVRVYKACFTPRKFLVSYLHIRAWTRTSFWSTVFVMMRARPRVLTTILGTAVAIVTSIAAAASRGSFSRTTTLSKRSSDEKEVNEFRCSRNQRRPASNRSTRDVELVAMDKQDSESGNAEGLMKSMISFISRKAILRALRLWRTIMVLMPWLHVGARGLWKGDYFEWSMRLQEMLLVFWQH